MLGDRSLCRKDKGFRKNKRLRRSNGKEIGSLYRTEQNERTNERTKERGGAPLVGECLRLLAVSSRRLERLSSTG